MLTFLGGGVLVAAVDDRGGGETRKKEPQMGRAMSGVNGKAIPCIGNRGVEWQK